MTAKQWLVCVFTFAVAFVVFFTVVMLASDGYTPTHQKINRACTGHGGVRQVPDDLTVVVCNDGEVEPY